MNKRKAIVEKIVRGLILLMLGIGIGFMITSSSDCKRQLQERQLYAQNAYNLGKAEYLGLSMMPPEEATEFQLKIQRIINSELTLEEQEEAMEEIFQILQEYIAGEEEPILSGL